MKKHIITLLLIAFAQTAFAVQIDSVRVSPANCGNDGSITVYLGGADLPLLENVIYSANGVQSSLNTIPNLAPGTYNVQVSGWIGNSPVILTTNATVGGTNSYIPLNSWITSTRYALPNMPIGNIKLATGAGKLPYKITITDGAGTVVFDSTFITRPAEHFFDNLPAAYYSIVISDGCTTLYLSTAIYNQPDPFDCNSSYMNINPTTHNVNDMHISFIHYTSPNVYRSEHESEQAVWWEYSYRFDGGAASEWKDLPATNSFFDTLPENIRFCDIWEKSYNVQIRIKGGNGAVICNQSGYINKPYIVTHSDVDWSDEEGCINDSAIYHFGIRGYGFYRLPLTVTITNSSTGALLYSGSFDAAVDKMRYFNPLDSFIVSRNMIGNLTTVLTDADGCIFGNDNIVDNGWNRYTVSSPCQSNFVGLSFLYYQPEVGGMAAPTATPRHRQGTIIDLFDAPDPQLRFTAAYDHLTNRWTTTAGRTDIEINNERIGLIDTSAVVTSGVLPSGVYKFHIYDECDYNDTVEIQIDFYKYNILEPLRIDSTVLTCEGVTCFPKSKVERQRIIVGGYESGEEISTYFNTYSTNGGSYSNNGGNIVNQSSIVINPQYNGQNHTFLINAYYFGDIVIPASKISYYTYSDNCNYSNDLTLNYIRPTSNNITHTTAYRCQNGTATIIATADSTSGILPHTFTLFSSQWGYEVETNTTGIFHINSPENNYLLRLSDNCNQSDGAYTEAWANISVLNIGIDRIILGRETLCFPSSDSLVCLLNAGSYEWIRPDGRIETGRSIHLSCLNADSLETGVYRLKINGLDCEVEESINIRVEYPRHDSIVLAPVCASELPVDYNGFTFTASDTIHTHYDISINGCDSTTTYRLPVLPVYDLSDSRTICETDLPYSYLDTVFMAGSESGVFRFRRKTLQNCDSIVTLSLSVGKLQFTELYDTIYSNEIYSKFGYSLPAQTNIGNFEYLLNLQSALGCDSTVTLYLTVNPDVKGRLLASNIELCSDKQTLSMPYEIFQGQADYYTVKFDTSALAAGFIDLYKEPLQSRFLEIPVPDNIRPNHYSGQITFQNIYGYTDSHKFDFTVLYSSSIIKQKWNDVLALQNDEYNGGYTFSAYEWYRNDAKIANEIGSYLYVGANGGLLDFTAQYRARLTRIDDGVTLFTCPITPVPHSDSAPYPTFVNANQYFTINIANKAGKITIYNSFGIRVREQNIIDGANQILAPNLPGAYILMVSDNASGLLIVK